MIHRRRLELKPEPGLESAIDRFAAAVDPDSPDSSTDIGFLAAETWHADNPDASWSGSPRGHSADFLTAASPDAFSSDAANLMPDTAANSPDDNPELPVDDQALSADAEAGSHFACPGCGGDVWVDILPDNGLIECPACKAEFFGVAKLSAEDQELNRQLEMERELAEERLGDLHRNVVLLERRGLFRTRSYLVIVVLLCLGAAMQAARYAFHRIMLDDWGWKLWAFATTLVVGLVLVWLCVRKIRAINAELTIPTQPEPTTPPDFSTLSDGSQVQDLMARNLERLG